VAEPAGDLDDDPDVVPRPLGRLERSPHTLHPALAVGDGAFGLAPRRARRQDDGGQLRGAGQEDVLHDEVVEVAEQLDGVLALGLRLRGVLADHVQGGHLTVLHGLEHPRQVQAVAGRDV
jgi:hypothetical protein